MHNYIYICSLNVCASVGIKGIQGLDGNPGIKGSKGNPELKGAKGENGRTG